MAESKEKPVYAIRKFTKKNGRSALLGEEIKGDESYKKYLLKTGLASVKKPSGK